VSNRCQSFKLLLPLSP